MRWKADLMDEASIRRTLMRITHEIIESGKGIENVILVGIRRRGVPLAEWIRDNILRIEGVEVPVGYLDITLHRDDLSDAAALPQVGESKIPVDVTGKVVVLVDDVLYTGRTVRAAIEGLFTFGRPAFIRLAVLVDRGHREMPIRADFVGKNVPTSKNELIVVSLPPFEEKIGVALYEN